MRKEMMRPAVVVHGGAGAAKEDEGGCVVAAQGGMERLLAGEDALAGALAAAVMLEDDERFNAGFGSVLCLDGRTIEMDAAVMDTRGRLGAVACLQRTKNPVLVARAVADTPHWLLAGEGAERFARLAGFVEHFAVSERAKESHRAMMARMASGQQELPGVENDAFLRLWNYPCGRPKEWKPAGCDTIGAVARDAEGHFAVAVSTGGTAPALLGRVGDTPIIGGGFYAGALGAVAATGIGEHIVRRLLAREVYGWIADGMPLMQALQRGIGLFPDEVDVGLIAVSRTEAGSLSNRSMPTHALEHHG